MPCAALKVATSKYWFQAVSAGRSICLGKQVQSVARPLPTQAPVGRRMSMTFAKWALQSRQAASGTTARSPARTHATSCGQRSRPSRRASNELRNGHPAANRPPSQASRSFRDAGAPCRVTGLRSAPMSSHVIQMDRMADRWRLRRHTSDRRAAEAAPCTICTVRSTRVAMRLLAALEVSEARNGR